MISFGRRKKRPNTAAVKKPNAHTQSICTYFVGCGLCFAQILIRFVCLTFVHSSHHLFYASTLIGDHYSEMRRRKKAIFSIQLMNGGICVFSGNHGRNSYCLHFWFLHCRCFVFFRYLIDTPTYQPEFNGKKCIAQFIRANIDFWFISCIKYSNNNLSVSTMNNQFFFWLQCKRFI